MEQEEVSDLQTKTEDKIKAAPVAKPAPVAKTLLATKEQSHD